MSIAYVYLRNILQIHGFNLLKCPLREDRDSLCRWVIEIQPAVITTFALSDLMALTEGLS